MLEINGDPIYDKSNSLNLIQKVLTAHRGKITLAKLPLKQSESGKSAGDRHTNQLQTSRNHHTDQNARDLYAKVSVMSSTVSLMFTTNRSELY
mgnify:FL=1